MFNRPVIWCCIGPSGCGKSTIADMLRENPEWNVICSYTTRPQRHEERNGIDHNFISLKQYLVTPKEDMIAYTFFGDHHYFATVQQINPEKPNFYVIDETGYMSMKERFGDKYELNILHVTSSMNVIRSRGISEERIARDVERRAIRHDMIMSLKDDERCYQFVIANNGSIKDLRKYVTNFEKLVKDMYS